MSKPTQIGKKFIQLTDNILLEYVFVSDPWNEQDDIDKLVLGYHDSSENVSVSELIEHGTYGRASEVAEMNANKYIIAQNGYTGENYFMNDIDSHVFTNNSFLNSVLPVKKDVTQWVRTLQVNGKYYSEIDSKWCVNMEHNGGEQELEYQPHPVVPDQQYSTNEHEEYANERAEYIPYDIARIYFQSGYHSEYDGFVFNFYTKDYQNKYVNLLSVIHENMDTNDVKMVSEPMWFADKIYTTYIEYRIPSTAYMSSDCIGDMSESMKYNLWHEYDRSKPQSGCLPNYITGGRGFYSNPAIGIDVHAIVGYTQKRDFKVYKTRNIVSTLFPNKDTYDKLFANIRNASDGDYYEIYGYYENDPSKPVYNYNSLYEYLSRFTGTFTITHIMTVSETYTNSVTKEVLTKVHIPMTYIQTWENIEEMYNNLENPVLKFRPVLEKTANMIGQNYGARINYTLRIISNRDNTSIIKTSSCAILNPRKYGKNIAVTTLNVINDVHVYNRIEQAPALNVTAVTTPVGISRNTQTSAAVQVNTYVTSSFIDRRNIRVSVSPVRIDNIEEQ